MLQGQDVRGFVIMSDPSYIVVQHIVNTEISISAALNNVKQAGVLSGMSAWPAAVLQWEKTFWWAQCIC